MDMLNSPIFRMEPVSISANFITTDFQRFGYRNGNMPSMINIKQKAVSKSCQAINLVSVPLVPELSAGSSAEKRTRFYRLTSDKKSLIDIKAL